MERYERNKEDEKRKRRERYKKNKEKKKLKKEEELKKEKEKEIDLKNQIEN